MSALADYYFHRSLEPAYRVSERALNKKRIDESDMESREASTHAISPLPPSIGSAGSTLGCGVSQIETVRAIGLRVRSNLLAMLGEFESDEHLTGLCAIASIGMMKSLHRHGITSQISQGLWNQDLHCWNLVGDRLVDLTLTQFVSDADPVHIGHWDDPDYLTFGIFDSIQKAADETWVSGLNLDWKRIVVCPDFGRKGPLP